MIVTCFREALSYFSHGDVGGIDVGHHVLVGHCVGVSFSTFLVELIGGGGCESMSWWCMLDCGSVGLLLILLSLLADSSVRVCRDRQDTFIWLLCADDANAITATRGVMICE